MALVIAITACVSKEPTVRPMYTAGVAQVGQPNTLPGQPPGFGKIRCVLASGYTDPGVTWAIPPYSTWLHLPDVTGNMFPTTTTVKFKAPGLPDWQAPNVRVVGGKETLITVSFISGGK